MFEKPVIIEHTDGSKAVTTCFIDVYKRDHFVFEAKQGGEKDGDSKGTAVRNTLGWEKAILVASLAGLLVGTGCARSITLEPESPLLGQTTVLIGQRFPHREDFPRSNRVDVWLRPVPEGSSFSVVSGGHVPGAVRLGETQVDNDGSFEFRFELESRMGPVASAEDKEEPGDAAPDSVLELVPGKSYRLLVFSYAGEPVTESILFTLQRAN